MSELYNDQQDHSPLEVPTRVGAFYMDDEVLSRALPEVNRIIELESDDDPYGYGELIHQANSELAEEFGRTPRTMRRVHEGTIDKCLDELVWTVAKQLHDEGITEDIQLAAQDIIDSCCTNVPSKVLALRVEACLIRAREVEDLSTEVIDGLRDAIEDDNIVGRYEILKLVAGEMTRHTMSPRKALLRMMQHTDEQDQLSYDKELLTDLEDGVFDSYIAMDSLEYARDNPEAGSNYLAMYSVEENYRHAFGDGFSDEELRERVVATTTTWPESAAAGLVRVRTDLRNKLVYNTNLARADQGFTLNAQTKPIEQVAGELQTAQKKVEAIRNRQLRIATQRNTRGKTLPPIRTSPLDAIVELHAARSKPEQEPRTEPRELYYVNTRGEEFPQDGPEFKKLVDEFIGRPEREDKVDPLRELLDRVLDKLAYLGSDERVTWIKKLNGQMGSGYNKLNIREVKTSDIPGISPGGDAGRALRVVFAFGPEEKIFIYAIEDRGDMRTMRRNRIASTGAR